MEALPLLIFAGLGLTIVIAFGNYQLYYFIFFDKRSVTNKAWFRALVVPFIYLPGVNVLGLLILLYMRSMKALDIN